MVRLQSVEAKRQREKRMVQEMVALYCRKKHGGQKRLCPECAALAEYAGQRSDRCPFMETKTFCSNCSVHCYRPDMREKNSCCDALGRAPHVAAPSCCGSTACD